MLHRSFWGLLLFCCLTIVSAHSAESTSPKHKRLKNSEPRPSSSEIITTYETGVFELPITTQTQRLLRIAYPQFEPSKRLAGQSGLNGKQLYIVSAMSKEWKQKPGTWVLLAEIVDSRDREHLSGHCTEQSYKIPGGGNATVNHYEDTLKAELSILKTDSSGHFSMVSEPRNFIELGIDLCMDVTSEFRFDFAPYKVAPGIPAFGIRTGFDYMGRGPGGGCRNSASMDLILFLPDGSSVKKILRTQMYSTKVESKGSSDDEDCAPIEKNYVLSVLQSKTNGYYDLEKRCRQGQCKPSKLTWDGKQYSEQ